MSNQTHLANFNGCSLEIVDHNGQKWLTAEQIGKALGLKHPRQGIIKIYNRHREEIDMCGVVEPNLGSTSGYKGIKLFTPRAARTIAFFCQTEMAARFRVWVLDTLEQTEQLLLESKAAPAALQAELLRARPKWQTIARCKEAGLNHVQTGRVIGCNSETVRRHVRRMETLGILNPPTELSRLQAMTANFGYLSA